MSEKANLKEIVASLEKELGCNCDLDNWEPERDIGHSHVCRIHQRAKTRYYNLSNGITNPPPSQKGE